MERIILAFSSDKAAEKLKIMLEATSYYVEPSVCRSGAELLRRLGEVDDALVIMGFKLPDLVKAMEALHAEKLPTGDVGYRFTFMPEYTMDFLLWAGDDEFQPSAQILFSDNIPPSFAPEDLVVMGDISITTAKKLAAN